MNSSEIYSPGLEGVIAGETGISTVAGGLRYRGYSVTELAEKASFDEVAYLLLHDDLPTAKELAHFEQRLQKARQIPETVAKLLREIPSDASSMDVLRSGVSLLAHYDPDVGDNSRAANLRKAERLLAQIPLLITQFYRAGKGLPPIGPRPGLAHAANLLYMLNGRVADADTARAMDVSLILYAEHEFNASTFAARVVCSTESDLHSSVVAAIGALKGRLHGGANEKVMDMLREAGSPESAEVWVRGVLARKDRIMGFGHRVYKTGDVRAGILKPYARRAAEASGQMAWEVTAEVIEKVLEQEKNLLPNLDWPAGRLYHALNLEISLYTPIFVVSRVAGWSAHIIEQMEHNRLIRPRGRYTGPDVRSVKSIEERS